MYRHKDKQHLFHSSQLIITKCSYQYCSSCVALAVTACAQLTAHSSQLTTHSCDSILTAHSSQLTAHNSLMWQHAHSSQLTAHSWQLTHVTACSQLTAHSSQLTAHSSQLTHVTAFSQLTAHSSQLTTDSCDSMLTAHSSQLTTHNSLMWQLLKPQVYIVCHVNLHRAHAPVNHTDWLASSLLCFITVSGQNSDISDCTADSH